MFVCYYVEDIHACIHCKLCRSFFHLLFWQLFVSLADCNLDYTSSEHFNTPSRTIVRFGDVRLSSNLVSPPGEIQAYRLSINDVSVHLSNIRSPYGAENARLAHASVLMSPEDLVSKPYFKMSSQGSPETTLQKQNFITIATLDSMDSLLAVSKARNTDKLHWEAASRNEPLVTASLTVGHLYLYACRDSFACLMDTIGEWQLKVTALTEEQVETLKAMSTASSDIASAEKFFDPLSEIENDKNAPGVSRVESESEERDLSHLKEMNLLSQPLVGVVSEEITPRGLKKSDASSTNDLPQVSFRSGQEFLLDGYDWTTVDSEWTKNGEMSPGEEQSARWYSSTGSSKNKESAAGLNAVRDPCLIGHTEQNSSAQSLRIFPQHIPLNPVADPLTRGDMDAPKLANTTVCPPVLARVLVRDFSFRCRFFDGYDWPKAAKLAGRRTSEKQDFVIAVKTKSREADTHERQNTETANPKVSEQSQRKAKLMGDLLDEQGSSEEEEKKKKTFIDIPLPEEKGVMLETLSENRRLARRSNRFFQMSLTGVKLRLDSFEQSSAHQLASCIHLSVADMFLAETVSSSKPVKMLGEWVNDLEHPRDTNDGLIMMKVSRWYGTCKCLMYERFGILIAFVSCSSMS